MKKLVLVAALFVFVCGGSFLAQAKNSATQVSEMAVLSNDTVVTDTAQVVKDVPDTCKVAE